MKILFIIPSITNYYTFLEDVAGELLNKGHEVFIACSSVHISDIQCYDRPLNGTLVEMDFPRGFEWGKHITAAKQLRGIVSELKPDIINVHFSAAMFTTAIAKTDEWPRTIAMIHGLASPILRGWRKIAIGLAERWAARKMDKVLLLNEVDRIALSPYMDEDRISVLQSAGLGCDLARFDRSLIGEEREILYHRRLGVKKGDFVFIFVGRQVHFKGFDHLIRAFLTLYGQHKNMKLLLVGAKDHIHSTNLTPKEEKALKNCPGIINVGWKENVSDYLLVADVNVFPSEREGMPVNLMESLAMGIPVITSDSRGCNEVVRHNINGLLLKNNSVQELSDNMLTLFNDHDLRKTLSENALNDRNRFDRSLYIAEMVEIFTVPKP